ncbi:Hypothetical protein, putative [Bodo saltans]|uniref:Uncharacterized protein n=1 Tax=Bodo saltans TaxID=75058 RepID=A0A0S4IW26_BODSA|nr:Hypothetical protein, putative [Bodo saltans]|eukprot:CUG05679.1 Hypothetical protein, putative [Bodo saltans]
MASSMEEVVVHQFWSTAEELWDQHFPLAAIATLEGLLRRPIPASLVVEDIKTRLRLADMMLCEAVHPEWARRTLEPARDLAHHHAVDAPLRVELLRLLSVCARRKHQHKLSVSYLEEALKSIADQRKRKVASLPVDLVIAEVCVHLELSRTWYSKLLETNFLDADAAHHLVKISSVYERFALHSSTSPMAITLCVCHIYGLLCASKFQDVARHLQQAVALFGAMPELTILKGLVEFSLLDGGPQSLALGFERGRGVVEGSIQPSSPLRKRVRSEGNSPSPVPATGTSDTSSHPHGVLWLSEGALFVHDQLVELLKTIAKIGSSSNTSSSSAASTTITPQVVDRTFASLMSSIEDQMKRLMNVKSGGAVTSNHQHNASTNANQSELRFLIAVKFCALSEVAALEITQLNFTAAVVKVDALRHYLELFYKHSKHFAHQVHFLAGVLFSAIAIGTMEDRIDGDHAAQAQHHFSAAAEAASDPQAAIFVDLMRCSLWWNMAFPLRKAQQTSSSSSAYQSRTALLASFSNTLDALKESHNDHPQKWTPRLRACLFLLCGCQSLEVFDYPTAVQHFKTAADVARKAMGMASPLLSLSLRLLAIAHHHSGVAEASDVAMTTSTQLSNRNHDESNLVHCLEWTLSRMLIGCDADIKHREQLLRSLESSREHIKVQLAHVVSMDELSRLKDFCAHAQVGSGGRPSGMGTPQSTGDSIVPS